MGNKNNQILRNFIWIITGIILMGFIVIADTTISNTVLSTDSINVHGNVNSTGQICDSTGCIGSGVGDNPFNQSLNTTDNVTFNNLNITGEICDTVGCTTSIGGLIFGSEFERFESLGQSNTGAALVDKLDVTTASKPAGTYRVGFTLDVTNSDGTDIYNVQFLVNNTPIHQHTNGGDLYENKPDGNNDWEVYSTFHYVTLSSPDTIDLNIKFGTNDNIARSSHAIIEIWRVS